MARYEFSVNYSEGLLRRSVRRHFLDLIRRELSWRVWVAVAVTGGLLAYGLSHGRASWIEGVAGAVLLLLPLLLLAGYRAHLRQGLDKLRTMGDGYVRFLVTDDALALTVISTGAGIV
jgi:hypothetical protein